MSASLSLRHITAIASFALGCLLAQTARTQQVQCLLQQTASGQPDVRRQAAMRLSHLGPAAKEAVPALTKLLQEAKEPEVRAYAGLALSGIGPTAKDAVSALIKVLGDDREPEVRMFAAAALGGIGPAKGALPALVKALQEDNDPDVRKAAAGALVGIGSAKDVVPALVKALQEDEEPEVVAAAATALGDIGPAAKDAVQTLCKVLAENKSPTVAQALGSIGAAAKPAIPVIIKVLRDEPFTRNQMAEALADIAKALGDAGAVDSIPALRDAQDALEKTGKARESADVRRAAETLAFIRDRMLSTRLQAILAWVKANPITSAWLSLP